jgi:hypothetical protein
MGLMESYYSSQIEDELLEEANAHEEPRFMSKFECQSMMEQSVQDPDVAKRFRNILRK